MEHTIDPGQLTTNIRKCLNAGMDEIVLVFEGAKGDLDSLRTILAEIPLTGVELEKVSYMTLKMVKEVILGKKELTQTED